MSIQRRSFIRRLRRVEAAELRLIVEAQLSLLACQVVRWTRPVGRLMTTVQTESSVATRAELRRTAQIGWAVDRAARYGVFRPKCLVRSLALQRMLRQHGLAPGELRIGVRRDERGFLAHAWIEVNGVVIGDHVQHVRTFTPASDLKLVEL